MAANRSRNSLLRGVLDDGPVLAAKSARLRQPGLELADGRTEDAGGEESRTERASRVFAKQWKATQGYADRVAHVVQLPRDLRIKRVLAGCSQAGGSGGVRGGAEGVSAHVRDTGSLCGGSGRGDRGWAGDHAGGAAGDEAVADLPCSCQFAAAERPGPGDRFGRPPIRWRFALEQGQHPLGAVRGPQRDCPPIGLAERLR